MEANDVVLPKMTATTFCVSVSFLPTDPKEVRFFVTISAFRLYFITRCTTEGACSLYVGGGGGSVLYTTVSRDKNGIGGG